MKKTFALVDGLSPLVLIVLAVAVIFGGQLAVTLAAAALVAIAGALVAVVKTVAVIAALVLLIRLTARTAA